MGVACVASERRDMRAYVASQKATPTPRQAVETGTSHAGAPSGAMSEEPMEKGCVVVAVDEVDVRCQTGVRIADRLLRCADDATA
jgi:hypothetical protein